MREIICPVHKSNLVPQKTKYGVRFGCTEQGCTVVCWDGSTSTPANLETRQARKQAHDIFDLLWKKGRFARKKLYKKLADYLGTDIDHTHIGQFDKETALKVVAFAKGLK